MIKVGITGQAGFVGTHLFNYLGLKENITRIPFEDDYFTNTAQMDNFVKQCDVIVHLAALNRHGEPGIIYKTNVKLVKDLIESIKRTETNPHILISSSTQESRDNEYGKSKKDARELLVNFCSKKGNKFTGMVIPNVFGPFGKPFYNSVVTTFAYQVTHNDLPEIQVDANMQLIYINDLVNKIYNIIINKEYNPEMYIESIGELKVTEVLEKMKSFQLMYKENGMFPDLSNYLDICLFNTYRSYLPEDYFPQKYILHTDNRGSFVETIKSKNQGQTSFSTTKPGITRGDHFHLRKVERFAVIKGKALIQLRKIGTDKIIEYKLSGDQPGYVDMPVWFTHNITNIGKEDLYTLFWINEFFNPDDPDTYYEKV